MGAVRGSAVVVGAGVIGCSTALELARHGWSVTVVDKGGTPGICTQGKGIPHLLEWWCARDGMEPVKSSNRKGSTWILSLDDGRLIAADYIASPLAVKRS